nr:hypothetical protein [Pandoravirus massiliensis]
MPQKVPARMFLLYLGFADTPTMAGHACLLLLINRPKPGETRRGGHIFAVCGCLPFFFEHTPFFRLPSTIRKGGGVSYGRRGPCLSTRSGHHPFSLLCVRLGIFSFTF